MKIVIFIDSLHSIAAGSERQIYKLIEGLVAAKQDVRLILLRHTLFSQNLSSFPCAIESLNINSILGFSAVMKMRKLRAQLLKQNVDIIHTYFPDTCLLAPLYLKAKTNKVISSRRDMGLIYQGKPAWLFKSLRKRVDKVISNSAAVAQLVQQTEALTPAQSIVIYNGIEAFDSQHNEQNETIFKNQNALKLILVANIKPVKRTLDAIKAVHQLLLKHMNIELALVGEKQDTHYIAELENYIQTNQLQDAIHWLGQIKEPRRLLKQAHIGLLISDSEGLSNAIMEYMQAGLPIIATNVGGNPELVTHDKNGLLIEKGNIEQLVDAIATLSGSETYRKALGQEGQARIQHEFSIAHMIEQHLKVYQEDNTTNSSEASAHHA